MGRRHAEEFLELLQGKGFARPNPRPMFPHPPGLLRLEPHSERLHDQIGWGSASNATAAWAAKPGVNRQTSTLKFDQTGEPLDIQQAAQIRAFRAAGKEAGHTCRPRTSVRRNIFASIDDLDRAHVGRGGQGRRAELKTNDIAERRHRGSSPVLRSDRESRNEEITRILTPEYS